MLHEITMHFAIKAMQTTTGLSLSVFSHTTTNMQWLWLVTGDGVLCVIYVLGLIFASKRGGWLGKLNLWKPFTSIGTFCESTNALIRVFTRLLATAIKRHFSLTHCSHWSVFTNSRLQASPYPGCYFNLAIAIKFYFSVNCCIIFSGLD